MIISLDKSIYHKDAIYRSVEVWNEYLLSPSVSENSKTIDITITQEYLEQKTISEFLNYILDLTSSMELS
ncbi:MAG: hypothetical protein QM490_01295 [Candidatus Gracilibacteria bacterium]